MNKKEYRKFYEMGRSEVAEDILSRMENESSRDIVKKYIEDYQIKLSDPTWEERK